MKKYIVVTIITLSIGLALVFAQNNLKNQKKNIRKELVSLVDKYGENIYKSFFSLENLRPYSILQIDKILDKYDNFNDISANDILSKLNENDKSNLLIKIDEYIANQETEKKGKEIIDNINRWCIINSQLDFIIKQYNFSKEEIISSSRNIIKAIFDENNILNNKSTEKNYNNLLNFFSNKENYIILKYTSLLYDELSRLEKQKNQP